MSEEVVLVADDAVLMRQRLASSLKELGAKEILEASNGVEAINAFTTYNIDIAFFDIDMPEIDGLTALKQVMANHPKAYVVMVTGKSTAANVKAALSQGAKGFIVKPLSEEKIQEAMSNFRKAKK